MTVNKSSQPSRLRISNVFKRFGSTLALGGVNLEVAPGEVHALIGENGAGKSTLMKILSGAHRPDSGKLELDGKQFAPNTPLSARNDGVAMIYQELNLAPDLSVEENILLGKEPKKLGWLNFRERRNMARSALREICQLDMPMDTPVRLLPIAQQQLVEIARALVGNPRVLIMDEPTSSLTRVDSENLFKVVDRMSQRGVSVIYISHFLEECQRVASRFTVLRDGKSVGSGEMDDVNLNKIINMMVGREVSEIYPRTSRKKGKVVMDISSLAGFLKPKDVSLKLYGGEIFGLFGLVGAGRTETMRVLFGLDRLVKGSVAVFGCDDTYSSPAKRLAKRVGLLSENRKEEGLLLNRSLADNLTLTNFRPVSNFGLVNDSLQIACSEKWINKLEVKASNASQPVSELSGGNQQKIAIARLLHHDAEILLLDEPTRGIDVGSKTQIYRLMNDLANRGKSIVFISSYLPELLGICDRISVMSRGAIVETKPVMEWSESQIIMAALGQTDSEKEAA